MQPGFDLSKKGADDAVARLVLSFSGDRFNGKWAARDHIVSELSSLIAGKPLPYASIMYVWDSRYPAGSVISNPYTDRIRQIVVESGPQRLNQWVDFERDVEADFRMAFGEDARRHGRPEPDDRLQQFRRLGLGLVRPHRPDAVKSTAVIRRVRPQRAD